MYLEIFLIILILEVVAFSILKSKRFKDRYSYIKRYFNRNLNNRYTKDNYSFFWNNKDYLFKTKNIFNEHGYRSGKILKKKKKILILGDSTSESIPYIKDTKDIWTTKVENLLKKNKKNFQVLNASLNCGTSNELLSHLIFKARYFNPKIIIFFAGINDLFPIIDKNFKSDYSHSKYYNKFYLKNYEKNIIKISYLFQLIFLLFTRKKKFSFFNIYNFNENNLNIKLVKKKIIRNNFFVLENNLKILKNYCKNNNIKLILIPPPVNKTNSKNLKLNELFILSDKLITKLFKKNKDKDCYFKNLDQIKNNDKYYLDFLHFNKNGHKKFSSEIFILLYKIINSSNFMIK